MLILLDFIYECDKAWNYFVTTIFLVSYYAQGSFQICQGKLMITRGIISEADASITIRSIDMRFS